MDSRHCSDALVTTIFLRSLEFELLEPGKHDVQYVLDAGVGLNNARGAVCLLYLRLDIRFTVLHKYGGVGVTLGQLFLFLWHAQPPLHVKLCVSHTDMLCIALLHRQRVNCGTYSFTVVLMYAEHTECKFTSFQRCR